MSTNGFFIGRGINKKNIQSIIENKFYEGEYLLSISKYNINSLRASYLLVTNKRIIGWNRSFTNSGTNSFNYDHLTTIFTKKTFLTNSTGITLSIDGKETEFLGMYRKDVDIVEHIIRNQIDQNKNSSQPVLVQNDVDPIKILELRFVNGEISEEEFLKKKSILVGSNSNNETKSSKVCKGCGTNNEPEAKFCASCGTSLV